jgi:hypothetical protein
MIFAAKKQSDLYLKYFANIISFSSPNIKKNASFLKKDNTWISPVF